MHFEGRVVFSFGGEIVGKSAERSGASRLAGGVVDGIFVQQAASQLTTQLTGFPADLVILNPPRAGVHADVADALALAPAERVIYVSCNPATLARDLKRMGETYRLESVRSFDLFPQTAHVETVVLLKRT